MKKTLGIYGIQDRSDSGFPEYIHDHSLCLMNNGRVEKFAQTERLTRQKFDNSLHKNIYNFLKNEKLITSSKYDVVFVDAVVGRSFISQNGKIRFEAPLGFETLETGLEKGRCWWFNKEIDAYVLNHELAHIYSCLPFYGDFKENSLLIHFDGGASISNFSAWHFVNGKLNLIEYNWDLKYLTALFNENALNYHILKIKRKEHNSLPGKYMGFASFGKYSEKIEEFLVNNNYFNNIWRTKNLFFHYAKKELDIDIRELNTKNKFIQDVAATVQHIFTRETIKKFNELQKQTNAQHLYYSGGCALSITTNSKLIEQQVFKNVFIPPCPSDTGLALGAAAFLEKQKQNKVEIHTPYLNNWDLDCSKEKYFENDLIVIVANLIMQAKIIGVSNGNGEIGPRALGNRSIIALANSKEIAEKVSMQCKKREWYRPIAPIMLEKNAQLITGQKKISHLAKYMLLDFKILDEYKEELEGVVHINGTSRIQSISGREENPFMFDLLTFLDKKHGIKALINTSFNRKGEPLVHKSQDAMTSAIEMKLDYIVIDYDLIEI